MYRLKVPPLLQPSSWGQETMRRKTRSWCLSPTQTITGDFYHIHLQTTGAYVVCTADLGNTIEQARLQRTSRETSQFLNWFLCPGTGFRARFYPWRTTSGWWRMERGLPGRREADSTRVTTSASGTESSWLWHFSERERSMKTSWRNWQRKLIETAGKNNVDTYWNYCGQMAPILVLLWERKSTLVISKRITYGCLWNRYIYKLDTFIPLTFLSKLYLLFDEETQLQNKVIIELCFY